MLEHTFCHLPGISVGRERQLWTAGIRRWENLPAAADAGLAGTWVRRAAAGLVASREQLAAGNLAYFSRHLPAREQWRLYPGARSATAYLDIETTGLSRGQDRITTIALFDGQRVQTFVRGENLADFPEALAPHQLLVTYNGKCFDLPFIEQEFAVRLPQAHLDLRYVLQGLGFRGGLKGCEQQLGIGREELAGVDGYFAVLLWNDYRRTGNAAARETLLAYNTADAVNLAALAVAACNLKLQATPFAGRALADPEPAGELPHRVDRDTVLGLRRRLLGW